LFETSLGFGSHILELEIREMHPATNVLRRFTPNVEPLENLGLGWRELGEQAIEDLLVVESGLIGMRCAHQTPRDWQCVWVDKNLRRFEVSGESRWMECAMASASMPSSRPF